MPTQVIYIALAAKTKPVIVTNHNTPWMKTPYQKFFNVFVGIELGKFNRKWDNNQVIHAVATNQFDFFVNGSDQSQRVILGIDDGARMRVESDQHAFPLIALGKLFYLFNDLLMAFMDAVKGSYRNDSIIELW
jgi:hypothetical protein